jgi:hypothetical protein
VKFVVFDWKPGPVARDDEIRPFRSNGLPASCTWAAVSAGAALALTVCAFLPDGADLRAFVPAEIGSIEAASWRHYYEKNYLALFGDLYRLSASQFHLSPWRSIRLAVDAAQAAYDFQGTHNRTEAARALPALRAYFAVLVPAKSGLDVDAAARAELDWWQARREGASVDDYGLRIAHVTTLLYGVDNPASREAGILRARAMQYRDERGAQIADVDWRVIEKRLVASYEELKRAVKKP